MDFRDLQKRELFFGAVLHILLLWAALALGYNTFKEIMRGYTPISPTVKDSIKESFPISVMIFLFLYIPTAVLGNSGVFLTFKLYVYLIIIYAVVVNHLFFAMGQNLLIPFNLSIVYFALLVTVLWYMRGSASVAYSLLYPGVRQLTHRRPLVFFVFGYMFIMVICGFLIVSEKDYAAEIAADMAFFLMVIIVLIEIINLLRFDRT